MGSHKLNWKLICSCVFEDSCICVLCICVFLWICFCIFAYLWKIQLIKVLLGSCAHTNWSGKSNNPKFKTYNVKILSKNTDYHWAEEKKHKLSNSHLMSEKSLCDRRNISPHYCFANAIIVMRHLQNNAIYNCAVRKYQWKAFFCADRQLWMRALSPIGADIILKLPPYILYGGLPLFGGNGQLILQLGQQWPETVIW